jgi:CrcB protein
MTRFLFIGLAGALGTWCRYLVGLGATKVLGTAFPYGTLIVNVVGCFLMGVAAQLALSIPSMSQTTRLVLTTGFLGGFTTYSAFNQETTTLLRERGATHAALNLGLTLAGCCVAGLLGTLAARRFTGG